MDARLKGWLVFGLLGSAAVYAIAEEFTLTTYYPSPRGVYADLRVGGGGPFPDPQGMLQVIKPTATDGDGKVAFRVDDQDGDPSPFVIDEAGNVGIGTASPGQRLHVIGDARIEGALKAQSFGSFSPLLFKTLDVERMRIDDTGNVGIGTTAPTALLHLSAASGDRRIQLQSGSSSMSLITDALGGIVSTEGTGPLTLRASPTIDHLVITTAGDVGIGMANPTQKLDVTGDMHATGDICTDQGGGRCLGTGTGATADVLIEFTFCNAPCEGTGISTNTYAQFIGGLYTGTKTDSIACTGGPCPPGPPPPDPPPSTPFIASWNGTEYIVDNDIMVGYPTSFRSSIDEAQAMYERGTFYLVRDAINPFRLVRMAYDRGDLIKLRQPVVASEHGHYRFLVLESQPEESFMDELKLMKAIHPPETELFVAANLSKFYALNTARLQHVSSCRTSRGNDCRNIVDQPATTTDALFLQEKEFAEVTFDYTPLQSPKLLIRAKYEPELAKAMWMPPPHARQLWLHHFSTHFFRLMDRVIPHAYGCVGTSVRVLYQDQLGLWKLAGVMHPRENYTTEVMELSPAAVKIFNRKRTIPLRLLWTQAHSVSFVGLVDGPEQPVSVQQLSPVRAYHHRNKADYTQQLAHKDLEYLHTIQGDVVELEFPTGSPVPEGKQATFLVAAEGFYTDLRAYLYPNADFHYYEQFWKTEPSH